MKNCFTLCFVIVVGLKLGFSQITNHRYYDKIAIKKLNDTVFVPKESVGLNLILSFFHFDTIGNNMYINGLCHMPPTNMDPISLKVTCGYPKVAILLAEYNNSEERFNILDMLDTTNQKGEFSFCVKNNQQYTRYLLFIEPKGLISKGYRLSYLSLNKKGYYVDPEDFDCE